MISVVLRRSLLSGSIVILLPFQLLNSVHAMIVGFKITQRGLSSAQLNMIGLTKSGCYSSRLSRYSLVAEFAQIYEVLQLTYPTTTLLPVSIQKALQILRTLKSTIYKACFLWRYVNCILFSTFLLSSDCRHIVPYSPHHHPRRLSKKKLWTDLAVKSQKRPHRKRQPKAMWRPFSEWRAKLLLVQLHMRPSWYVQQVLFLSLLLKWL